MHRHPRETLCWGIHQFSLILNKPASKNFLSRTFSHKYLSRWQVIGAAIIGFGTDEDSLNRAIVARAEIDTMKIRGEYFNIFKTNLDGAVTGDTSGDYKDFLMTLLGARIWFTLCTFCQKTFIPFEILGLFACIIWIKLVSDLHIAC